MDRVQGLKGLLECWAELIEQCRLAGKNSITSTRWSLDHAEKGVRGRVQFK
jgi:hypothetical protein